MQAAIALLGPHKPPSHRYGARLAAPLPRLHPRRQRRGGRPKRILSPLRIGEGLTFHAEPEMGWEKKMPFMRAFMGGALIAAAFPGLIPGIFLALPIFFIAAVLLTGAASSLYALFGHPAIALLAVGTIVMIVLRVIGWLSGRYPRASASTFAAVYAVFYGAMAYGISSSDWIWTIVIGGLAGGYVYRKTTAALIDPANQYKLSTADSQVLQ